MALSLKREPVSKASFCQTVLIDSLFFHSAIDEEFISQLKNIEAGLKSLKNTLLNYEEKKQNMHKEEKAEREQVINLLETALKLLNEDFKQQTKQFKSGGGFR